MDTARFTAPSKEQASDLLSLPIRPLTPPVLQVESLHAETHKVSQQHGCRASSRVAYASEELWAKHKNLIGKLYHKYPLPHVMNVMEAEHGIKATRKMYIVRLEKWGFATKNKRPRKRTKEEIRKRKEAEERKLSPSVTKSAFSQENHELQCRAAESRSKQRWRPLIARDKRPIVPVACTDSNSRHLSQSVGRQGASLERSKSNKSFGVSRHNDSCTSVVTDSPFRIPVACNETIQTDKSKLRQLFSQTAAEVRWVLASHQTRGWLEWQLITVRGRDAGHVRSHPQQDQICAKLTLPDLHDSEKAIWAINTYCKGCADMRLWRVDEKLICTSVKTGLDTYTLATIRDYSFRSLDLLLRNGNTREAERSLVAAMAPLERLIRAEVPGLFMVIVEAVAAFARIDEYIVIATSIAKQFASMAAIVLGDSHPLAVAAKMILQLDPCRWLTFTRALHEAITHFCEGLFSMFCSGCVLLRRCYRSHIAQNSGPEAALAGTRKIFDACETSLGVAHEFTSERRVDLVNDLVDAGCLEEAIELGQQAVRYKRSVGERFNTLWALGRARAEFGLIEQARWDFTEAIALMESESGRYDAQVIRCLDCLQDYLIKWGDLETAAEMEKDLQSRMDAIVELI